jgi:hypothetical protein
MRAQARTGRAAEKDRERKAREARVADLETHCGARNSIKDLESRMSAPGFYEDRKAADRQPPSQSLMWSGGADAAVEMLAETDRGATLTDRFQLSLTFCNLMSVL